MDRLSIISICASFTPFHSFDMLSIFLICKSFILSVGRAYTMRWYGSVVAFAVLGNKRTNTQGVSTYTLHRTQDCSYILFIDVYTYVLRMHSCNFVSNHQKFIFPQQFITTCQRTKNYYARLRIKK